MRRGCALAVLGVVLLLDARLSQAQIPAAEFAARRAGLVAQLGEGLYYFEGAPPPRADYETWAQEAYFHYLTGLEEPQARLLMLAGGEGTRSVLFVQPRNPAREIWEGHRMGAEGAAAVTGMEARALEEFDGVLAQMLREAAPVLVSLAGPTRDETVGGMMERMASRGGRGAAEGAGVRWISPAQTLNRMRSVKSAAEIELLRTASAITRQSHLAAMQGAAPGMNEFELQAVIEFGFRRYGARRPGFASIVGSGPNSTTLHYNANDRFMQAGEVVVMDIGAEYGRYTTDITRTIPVSGRFSPEQREIYQIVYDAQQAAERLARTEGTAFTDLSRAATRVLAEGLTRLGLIESADATLPGSRTPQYTLFYMHGLGHGIGLDVHDPNSRDIVPGYCFTIEPGLYIRQDALDRIGQGPAADALRGKLRPVILKYRDIGVRIEDSYAFTSQGLERLSEGIPRTIQEIEAAMRGENFLNAGRLEDLIERYRVLQPPPPR